MISHQPSHAGRLRALASTAALFAVSAVTVAALLASRPHLAGRPASWRGDDLAITSVWIVAIVCAAWLMLSTLACLVALTSGHLHTARLIAGWAPPAARRVLQTALIGTWVLAPTAAFAVAPTTPAPLVVHVDRNGRIAQTPGPGLSRTRLSNEAPVVREPRVVHPTVTTTTTTTAAARTPTTAPAPSAPAPRVAAPVVPVPTQHPAPATRASHTRVVRAGDDLWRLARAEVARSTGVFRPDERAIARYWLRVIAANRHTLRSGNPSLIFPGEIVTLP